MVGHLHRFAIAAFVSIAAGTTPVSALDGGRTIDFGESKIGTPPDGFDFEVTGRGHPGEWIVALDATSKRGVALEQSRKDPTDDRFSLAIYRLLSLKDVAVQVRLKLLGGTTKCAGIALRVTDRDNYYVVGVNALEQRVDLFRVLAGKMERIGGAEADVGLDRWHALGVVMEADRFVVLLDRAPLFAVSDQTFSTEGRIGFWVQEDSIARFDQLDVVALPQPERL